MKFTDAVAVSGTKRTADGYLVAEARCVRTGIQLYTGDEVGKPEMDVVRVYRAPDQVFAQDSLQSFSHAPVTVNHPAESVTSDNWKDLSVGEVSTAAKQDGQWVYLPLILKDAAAIRSVEDGKRELSAGYMCELDWTPGTTADGEPFDAQQKSIKINHLALVDRARAGSEARIGDGAAKWGTAPITQSDKKEDTMSDALKTVVLGDKAAQVAAADAAIIEQFKTDQAKALADAKADHDKAIAAKDAELAKKDGEIDDLKKQVLSDADLDKRVQARASLVDSARKVVPDVKVEGLSDADIRKAVVKTKLGDDKIADKSDAYIEARFDGLVEDAGTGVQDTFRTTVQSIDRTVAVGDAKAQADAAYAKRNQELNNAWEGKAA